MRDHPDKYGKAIAKGICQYMGVKFSDGSAKPAASGAEIYRVRKAWNKPETQKGAYKDLANAKKCADKNGYSVFNKKGKAVYNGKK